MLGIIAEAVGAIAVLTSGKAAITGYVYRTFSGFVQDGGPLDAALSRQIEHGYHLLLVKAAVCDGGATLVLALTLWTIKSRRMRRSPFAIVLLTQLLAAPLLLREHEVLPSISFAAAAVAGLANLLALLLLVVPSVGKYGRANPQRVI
ncbi:hypothetical protein [Kribbella sp. NPDC004536]|uniref:hypothetical protein n=1 Tax=Kribbella sp. NPDC004536 TaxID=3364106 RepID=UPI00367CBC82